ncbi:protein snail-like [Ctenocephalides felis]|uniref:protein snail-like n=1 Tax=Ctenocephalides felis TaxID=7515 RepID=UPI000E6E434F|nr:protein snail-like [Ctenocephalides felis]
MAMHMASHIQPEAFTCTICNKILTCPKILQNHIQNHLPESQRPLCCPEPTCSRRFSYYSALTAHQASHLNEEEKITHIVPSPVALRYMEFQLDSAEYCQAQHK